MPKQRSFLILSQVASVQRGFNLFLYLLFSLQLQMTAKDSDSGDYGTLTYDIISDMAKEVFAIDGDSGQITTKIRLDRETKMVRNEN